MRYLSSDGKGLHFDYPRQCPVLWLWRMLLVVSLGIISYNCIWKYNLLKKKFPLQSYELLRTPLDCELCEGIDTCISLIVQCLLYRGTCGGYVLETCLQVTFSKRD